ncbi:LysR family transcriptional regulator [Mesorhizobium sp. M0228]|uniref:LysR family transcriptional regulator n=1 Tax=Mesorhizobium sp. M0228 TaxID=2956923 RepID=UPI00333B772C
MIAEEGSFLRAARRAGIDHTALSRRIRDLEYAMGTRIFHCHARGVGPTPAGERFLNRLRSVLLELDNSLTLARTGIKDEQQRLSIGSNGMILAGRALDATIEFGKCHPNVTVSLIEVSHPEPWAALGGTEVDVILALQWPIRTNVVEGYSGRRCCFKSFSRKPRRDRVVGPWPGDSAREQGRSISARRRCWKQCTASRGR